MRKTKAQAMLEFALALPILLMLVIGLLETGRLLFIYATTISAAREAVRYGSAMGKNGSNVPFYQDCAGIRNAARKVAIINEFNDSDIQITYDGGLDDSTGSEIALSPANPACGSYTGIKTGDRVKVTVSTQWQPVVSFIPLKPLVITSSNERTVIKSISVSVVPPAPPSDDPPIPPSLISPADNSSLAAGSITFNWSTSSGATLYYFEYLGPISGNSGWITGTSFSTTIDVFGEYSWRVKAQNGNGESDWSDIWEFDVLVAPAAPALVSPSNGSTLSSGSITFDISPSVSATEYYFEYIGPVSGNSGWITVTSFTIPLNTGGDYTWRVKARNPGAESPWSDTWSLTIVVPPPYSILLGVSPTSHDVIPKAGDLIPFTYTISNLGSQPATGVRLTPGSDLTGVVLDSASCPNPINLSIGQTTSCLANRIVAQSEIDAGLPLSNTWMAHGDLAPFSNEFTTTITLAQLKAISISSLTGVLSADTSKITYTYVIKNTGNVTLSAPSVSDTKGTAINCPAGSLAPNNTTNCIGEILRSSLSAPEIAAGSLTITGTATANFNSAIVSDSKSVTTPLSHNVCDASHTVTVSDPVYNTNGKTASWTITKTAGYSLTITSLSFKWKAGEELDVVSLSPVSPVWSKTNLKNTSGSVLFNSTSTPSLISEVIASGTTSVTLSATFKNSGAAVNTLVITFSETGCGPLTR